MDTERNNLPRSCAVRVGEVSILSSYFCAVIALTLMFGMAAQAQPITIPNFSFQLPDPGGDGNPDDEDAYDVGNGNPLPSNWTFIQSNGNMNYGQQRPDPDAHFTRDVTGGERSPFTAGGFADDLIVFANINAPGDIFTADSDVVGQLGEGSYTLTVGLGARNTGSWNDLDYTVGLVGSSSGVLGTPTAVTLNPGDSAMNTVSSAWTTDDYNVVDVSYVLSVPVGSGLIGENYFVRITAANSGFHDGVADTDFTQAAIDNVRLTYIPEPGTFALAGLGALVFGGMAWRRRRA